jgi:hypothetical protein
MKKTIVLLGFLGFYLQMNAEDTIQKNASKSEIILDAKYLFIKQKMLQNKKAAWQKRVVGLIEDFYQKIDSSDYFGRQNKYGKARLRKREEDFYSSLQAQSEEIEQNLRQVNRTLKRVQKQFNYLYARPLTKEEIEGKKRPQVVDKWHKIQLLKAYISLQNSWKRCFKRNKIFDQKRVEIANSLTDDKKYLDYSMRLDKKVEENFVAMNSYSDKAVKISQEYKELTGTPLRDVETAKLILRHIKEGN